MQTITYPLTFEDQMRAEHYISEGARVLLIFLGVVLCLAAFGLWLVPEAVEAPEARVIRAGLTCLFIGAGYFLFRKGREDLDRFEQELDLVKGELRHLSRSRDGIGRVIARIPLADLRFLDVGHCGVALVDAGGAVMMQIPEQVAEGEAFQQFLQRQDHSSLLVSHVGHAHRL